MRSASGPSPSKAQRASFRQRAAAFVVAIAVQVLLIVMLLGLAPSPMRLFQPDKPSVFQLLPEPRTPAPRGKSPVKTKRASGGAPRKAPTPPVTPPEKGPPPPLAMIPLSRSDFAASNIATLPSHHDEIATANSGAGTGSGRDSGAADGAGQGPGGEQLFNAEWYREPTSAELAFYLPKDRAVSGWGMIACRTIANFQVDDCKELGDSPMGSGLARAVREAAWQFRVRPPRVNGRSLVGSWVRIRIDYTASVGAIH